MKVTVNSSTQARRLELDGYGRTGTTEITTPLSNLRPILGRDDVEVEQVELHRRGGNKEADIIDEYVMAEVPDRNYSGEIKERYFKTARTHQLLKNDLLRAKTRTILEASEDKLVVKRRFKQALLEDAPITEDVTDDVSFRKKQATVESKIDEKIGDLQQKINRLEARRNELADMTPEDV